MATATETKKPADHKVRIDLPLLEHLLAVTEHDLGVRPTQKFAVELAATHYIAWLTDPQAIIDKERARLKYMERLESAHQAG